MHTESQPVAMLSPEDIAALKRKHGPELFLVEVEPAQAGDNPLQFVLKKPDRKTLSASSKVAMTDPIAAADVAIKNCLVWGDPAHLEDVSIFQALAEKFEEINKARQATLKNL